MTRQRWRLRLTRDLAVFILALGLLVNEAALQGARPDRLTIYVMLLFSPGVIRYDEYQQWRRRNGRREDERDEQ